MNYLQKLEEKYDIQSRNMTSLEERCSSLKSTIDQLNIALERASSSENEMRNEIQSLQRTLLDTSSVSQTSNDKLKQVLKIKRFLPGVAELLGSSE